jgi:hypothetical protein
MEDSCWVNSIVTAWRHIVRLSAWLTSHREEMNGLVLVVLLLFVLTWCALASGPGSSNSAGAANQEIAFDGWYPSFMSPEVAAGHISSTGTVFFMNACDTGQRTFSSRGFTIKGSVP